MLTFGRPLRPISRGIGMLCGMCGIAFTQLTCAISRNTVANVHPPNDAGRPTTNTRDASPFHVVAEGMSGTDEYPTSLSLCVVDSRAFLCGTGFIEEDGRFVKDDTLLATRGSWLAGPVGRLPSDVWIVEDHFFDPNGPPVPALFRFDRNSWQPVTRVGTTRAAFVSFRVSAWTAGRALVIEAGWHADEHVTALHVLGEGKLPAPPQRTRRRGVPVLRDLWEVHGFANGAVVMVGSQGLGERIAIEIWQDPTQRSQLIELDSETDCTPLSVHAFDPSDVVIVGVIDSKPCAAHIRDGTARRVELPQQQIGKQRGTHRSNTEAWSYAREPNGTEWIVLGAGHFD